MYALNKISEVPLPIVTNLKDIENYYLTLSLLARKFIKNKLYIRATQMTTGELNEYFINDKYDEKISLMWMNINSKSDMAKYAALVPSINSLMKDKNDFIKFIEVLETNY